MVKATPILLLALVAAAAGAAAQPHQPAEHGANPTVSPDGRRIAFVSDRDGAGDIYVMDVDGSHVRRVTAGGGHGARAYWGTDSKRLTFSRSANDTAYIYAVPADSGTIVELGRFPARGDPILLGTSRALYGVGSWTETQLVTSRLDGSSLVKLTADRAAWWCPAVPPQGDFIAVGRRDTEGMQIWVMGVDGTDPHALTHFTKAEGAPQCPAVSADGRRIAFQNEVADPRDPKRHAGHIWVVDIATGRTTQLATHAEPFVDELPTWFPNGKRIAFQSDRTGRWEVWSMNADGTDVKQLTR